MENKTKEQLGDEYAEKFRYVIRDLNWFEGHKQDFIAGWEQAT